MLRALPLFYLPRALPRCVSWVFVLEEERMRKYQPMDVVEHYVYVREHPRQNQQDQKTYPAEPCANE